LSDTLVAVVVSAVVAFVVARITASSQRALAREERTYASRSEAYVALVDFAMRDGVRTDLIHPRASFGPPPKMPEAVTDDAWYLMHARVNAFGSKAVRVLLQEVMESRLRFDAAAGWLSDAMALVVPLDQASVAQSRQAREALEVLRGEYHDALRRTIAAVNGELNPGEVRRWFLGPRKVRGMSADVER
jgi:hypothetical protein